MLEERQGLRRDDLLWWQAKIWSGNSSASWQVSTDPCLWVLSLLWWDALHVGLGALLKRNPCCDGMEHRGKMRTEDPSAYWKASQEPVCLFQLKIREYERQHLHFQVVLSLHCECTEWRLLSLGNSGSQLHRPSSPHTYLWTGILLGYTCSTSWQRPPSCGQSSVLPQADGSSIGTVCQV